MDSRVGEVVLKERVVLTDVEVLAWETTGAALETEELVAVVVREPITVEDKELVVVVVVVVAPVTVTKLALTGFCDAWT
jgi:hypothetical protein